MERLRRKTGSQVREKNKTSVVKQGEKRYHINGHTHSQRVPKSNHVYTCAHADTHTHLH